MNTALYLEKDVWLCKQVGRMYKAGFHTICGCGSQPTQLTEAAAVTCWSRMHFVYLAWLSWVQFSAFMYYFSRTQRHKCEICHMIKSFPNMLIGLERIHIFKSKWLIGLYCCGSIKQSQKTWKWVAWLCSNKT